MRTPLFMLCFLLLLPPGCDSADAPDGDHAKTSAEVPPIKGELAAAFRLIQRGDPGPSRIRLRQWMDANGDDSRALFLFGLAYHHERLYARSLDWFTQSTQASPAYPPAWHFLGWSAYYLGRPDVSETAFRRHLSLNPEEGDSIYGIGLVMLDAGRLQEADLEVRREGAAGG